MIAPALPPELAGGGASALAGHMGRLLDVKLALAARLATADLLAHPLARHAPPGARRRPARHREWVAARLALQSLLPTAREAASERFPAPDASLSHSQGVGVALHVPGGQGCGVDLEHPRALAAGAERHFLCARERRDCAPDADLLLFWAIKEAVFKADAGNAGRVLAGYALDTLAPQGLARRAEDTAAGPRFRYAGTTLADGWRIALAVRVPD